MSSVGTVTRDAAGAAAAAFVTFLKDNGTAWRGRAIDLLPTRVLFALSEEDLDELETDRATGEDTHSPRSALAFFGEDEVTWSQDEYYTARRALYRDLCDERTDATRSGLVWSVSEGYSVGPSHTPLIVCTCFAQGKCPQHSIGHSGIETFVQGRCQ